MNKKCVIIIMITLSLAFSGCINNENNNKKIDEKTYYNYQCIINPKNNTDFEIYLPLIIPDNGIYYPDIVNNEIINNSNKYNIKIIETYYGYAFKINSSSNITIYYNFSKLLDNKLEYDYYILSLFKNINKDLKYYIYLNESSNNIINIDLKLSFKKDTDKVYVQGLYGTEGNIKNGWNELDGKYQMKIS